MWLLFPYFGYMVLFQYCTQWNKWEGLWHYLYYCVYVSVTTMPLFKSFDVINYIKLLTIFLKIENWICVMLHKIFWTPWSSTHTPTGTPAVVEGRVTDKVDDALVLVVVGHTTGCEHIYSVLQTKQRRCSICRYPFCWPMLACTHVVLVTLWYCRWRTTCGFCYVK